MPDTSFVVEPTDGRATWFDGSLVIDRVIEKCTEGAYAMIEHHLPPGYETPPHVHHGEKEIRYVLEGQVTVETPEGSLSGTAGETLVLKRGQAHALRASGEQPGRTLALFNPAGVEELYHAAGREAASRTVPEGEPTGADRFVDLAPEYDVEILSGRPNAGAGGPE